MFIEELKEIQIETYIKRNSINEPFNIKILKQKKKTKSAKRYKM
jgi:hypothetical protein